MIYIFDLDGTLADNQHRRHWLNKEKHPELNSDERWARFFDPEEVAKDKPFWHVINVMEGLLETGSDIWVWSARPERLREVSKTWLRRAGTGHTFIPWRGEELEDTNNHGTLRMREDGDFRPDHELKESWLKALPEDTRGRIAAVFDDRQSVVDMWRRNGIPCFQVAPGNF